ncbi:MAG: Gfo/Idh/MocA family oxidoreductase [Bryobacterales bacterium]|nr:Gfo/Idh/MocA family oxidoreductase [Bryobacterales bacterium]
MNRRHFLLTSSLASHAAFGQSSGDRSGTAMIGVGNRGAYVMQGVLEDPRARVAALCDIKADRLDKAATTAARDNPQTYKDWRPILDRKDIDAVFIATPPHLHAEMAIAALKAGKHVYCEKPIAITAETVRDVVRAAKASNKVFMVGQQLRSFRQITQAIAKIRQGEIGEILALKAQRNGARDLDHNGPSADWYFDVNKSGGYLIEMSVHNLDLCNWAAGMYPVRAAGFGGTMLYKNDPPGRTIMDGYQLTFEYSNGATLSFSQLLYHPSGLPAGAQYVNVYGSKGAVDLMGTKNFYPLEQGAAPRQLAPEQEEPRHAHVTAFYDCVTKGAPNPADIKVGASGALTAILGHEAIRRGKVMAWKELGVDL